MCVQSSHQPPDKPVARGSLLRLNLPAQPTGAGRQRDGPSVIKLHPNPFSVTKQAAGEAFGEAGGGQTAKLKHCLPMPLPL